MTPAERGALLERARALQAAGSFDELAAVLRTVDEAELLAEPEFGFLLATAHYRLGDRASALALLERLGPPCDRRGNDGLGRSRLNLLAATLYELGRLREAEAVWSDLLDAASTAADEESLARVNTNLGVIATLRGRMGEAIASFGRAAAAYRPLVHRRGLALSLQNMAIAYREQGFLDEAERYFQQALELARGAASPDVEGRAEEERALLLFLRGDVAHARAAARRALDRLAAAHDRAGEGEALRVLGLIALGAGEFDDAGTFLERALERARASRQLLLEAELLEARAALRLRTGRPGASADRARARRHFRRLGAEGWGERERERVARIAGLHPAGGAETAPAGPHPAPAE